MRCTNLLLMALMCSGVATIAVGCDDRDAAPECSEDDPDRCGDDTPYCLLEESRCVECLDAEGCGEGGRCVDWACLPALAPDFALPDRNPRSATFEETITLGDHRGEVVLVYFASLG